MSAEYVLEMRNITKEYGATAVLKDVTFKVRPGEIHALLGENGAGKSTLMNLLFGMPVIHETGGYKGEVLLDGKPVSFASPHDAMHAGIGMVHQEFMLIPGFSITENIKLNREIAYANMISSITSKSLETLDTKAMAEDARRALDAVGIDIPEDTLVKGLPVGHMQFVEIAREIDKQGIKLLVFDEPTAVLAESEAEQLIRVMRSIADKGIAIIFITHRLDEVMNAADAITVLRDGKLVAAKQRSETSLSDMAELMIGRAEGADMQTQARTFPDTAKVILSMRNFAVDMPGERVKDVTLDVREGEILGIGGLAGQGKVGIPNGIMGLFNASGDVKFCGEAFPLNDAKSALEKRLAMVSEDRRGVGLLLDESIEDNIAFSSMQVDGAFRKPVFASLTDLRKKPIMVAIIAIITAICIALGVYGSSLAGEKTPVASVEDVLLVDDATPLDDAADGEISIEDMGSEPVTESGDAVVIDESLPIMARLAPLFYLLGGIGALAVLYMLLYPVVGKQTDKLMIKDGKGVRNHAEQMIRELDIRCRGPLQASGTLSGGNQQKVCVARALTLGPKLLFVSEPTRGIDIGAKKLVLDTLVKLNRELNMTVVMVSSELLELRSICDRIAIVSDGTVVDIFSADAPDVDIGLAMSGIRADAAQTDGKGGAQG